MEVITIPNKPILAFVVRNVFSPEVLSSSKAVLLQTLLFFSFSFQFPFSFFFFGCVPGMCSFDRSGWSEGVYRCPCQYWKRPTSWDESKTEYFMSLSLLVSPPCVCFCYSFFVCFSWRISGTAWDALLMMLTLPMRFWSASGTMCPRSLEAEPSRESTRDFDFSSTSQAISLRLTLMAAMFDPRTANRASWRCNYILIRVQLEVKLDFSM